VINKYNIQDEVYLLWGGKDKYSISEISIQPSRKEYKLWKQGTADYNWFESWQITKEGPEKIWFKTN